MAPSFDLLVKGGRVVLPEAGTTEIDLGIRDGRIAAHLSPGAAADAAQTLDAAGRVILPGLFDAHIHFTYGAADDVFSESRSAALGGVTTVNTYYRQKPDFLQLWPEMKRTWESLACIDFTTTPNITARRYVEEIPRYASEFGMTSVKFFFSHYGELGAEGGITEVNDALLDSMLRAVARVPGGLVCLHCENADIVHHHMAPLKAAGKQDLVSYEAARPAMAEAESVVRAAFFAERTGTRLLLAHISSAEALAEAARAKARVPGISVETCPHYLVLSADMPLGTLGKVNPPLRFKADQEALWAGLADGTVDQIGTDHIGWDWSRKSGDLWKAGGSWAGMGTLLPILLNHGYHQRGLSLQRIAQLTSTNPARTFGLYPRKGSLLVGSDADLVLLDLDKEQVVDSKQLGSRAEFSPFDGQKLKGWPVLTVSRGKIVARDGQFLGSAGHGKYLPR